MKKVIAILVLIAFKAVSQPMSSEFEMNFDIDSINYHFKNFVNEHRQQYGLPPVVIAGNTHRNYAEDHVYFLMANMDSKKLIHSTVRFANGNMVEFRRIVESTFSPDTYFFENCAKVKVYGKMENTIVSYPNSKEIESNYQNMITSGPTNKIIAKSAFLEWKNSVEHNKIMLHNMLNQFYLACTNFGDTYFFEFVGTN